MDESFLNQYPELIAIAIAILGFVAANLFSRWFERLAGLVDRGMRRFAPSRADQLASITPSSILQKFVYYGTLIFFLLLAARFLGINELTIWLDAILGFIPQLLLGAVIIIAGYMLGILAYSVVGNFVEGTLMPRAAQIFVVVTAVMTGLQQMAIDVSFISDVIIILLGASLGGLAIAFGFGSRDLVANLLAKRNLDRYRVGDTVRIDEIEGTILEFTRTGVAVQTSDGVVNVPAQRFVDSIVTVIKS